MPQYWNEKIPRNCTVTNHYNFTKLCFTKNYIVGFTAVVKPFSLKAWDHDTITLFAEENILSTYWREIIQNMANDFPLVLINKTAPVLI